MSSEKKSFRLEALERANDLFSSALSLVAALAWNDAVQAMFKMVFGEAASLYAKFLYAILITLVIIAVTRYLMHLTTSLRQQIEQESTVHS